MSDLAVPKRENADNLPIIRCPGGHIFGLSKLQSERWFHIDPHALESPEPEPEYNQSHL